MPYKDKKDRLAYRKQYREKNKEMLAEKYKEYRANNKEKETLRHKKYRENNREMLANKRKQYREKNKEMLAEKDKEYRAKNKEKETLRHKKYHANNRDKARIKNWKHQGIIDGDFPLLNEVFENETHCWICWEEYSKTRIKSLDHDWSIKDDSNPRYICCHVCNLKVVG